MCELTFEASGFDIRMFVPLSHMTCFFHPQACAGNLGDALVQEIKQTHAVVTLASGGTADVDVVSAGLKCLAADPTDALPQRLLVFQCGRVIVEAAKRKNAQLVIHLKDMELQNDVVSQCSESLRALIIAVSLGDGVVDVVPVINAVERAAQRVSKACSALGDLRQVICECTSALVVYALLDIADASRSQHHSDISLLFTSLGSPTKNLLGDPRFTFVADLLDSYSKLKSFSDKHPADFTTNLYKKVLSFELCCQTPN
jgi:hypothetical protein